MMDNRWKFYHFTHYLKRKILSNTMNVVSALQNSYWTTDLQILQILITNISHRLVKSINIERPFVVINRIYFLFDNIECPVNANIRVSLKICSLLIHNNERPFNIVDKYLLKYVLLSIILSFRSVLILEYLLKYVPLLIALNAHSLFTSQMLTMNMNQLYWISHENA